MAHVHSGSRRSVLVLASTLLWSNAADAQLREQRGVPTGDVQSWFLQWPLPSSAEQYADIDGRRMHRFVVEQAEISRRYRDNVHPKFWGRIIGTSADAESAEWLADKFRSAGLSDVRIQEFDLPPQWFPQTYRVTATAGGETMELVSAQPFYRSVGTPPGGLQLEAVYVGLGSEADFIGRDVAGKAVFTYSMLGAPSENAWRLAASKGAAVVFDAQMLPGNMRYQAYPSGTDIPAFTLGGADGMAVRDMIASTAGQLRVPVQINVRLDVEMVPNLKTALVWGTLPGASDETIYLIAHRDGWFDAAGDNASGVASIIELAEHYAKIPQAERPRTIVFVGLDGHHNSGEGAGVGRIWMVDHREELFSKTALMINAEHPSTYKRRRDRGTWAATSSIRSSSGRTPIPGSSGTPEGRRGPSSSGSRSPRSASSESRSIPIRTPGLRRVTWVGSIPSSPVSRPASSITISTPTSRRRTPFPGPGSRQRRGHTRASSTKSTSCR